MKMKQTFIIPILSLTMIIFLAGCIMIPRYKYYDIDSEKVSSIEIYDLRNYKELSDNCLQSPTTVYTVPVYILEEDKMSDFLSDLSDIRFSDAIVITFAAVDPSFDFGDWIVRINYTDGAYSLISCGGYGEDYDANDQITKTNHFDCEDDEWEQFIGRYVPEDIFKNQE